MDKRAPKATPATLDAPDVGAVGVGAVGVGTVGVGAAGATGAGVSPFKVHCIPRAHHQNTLLLP